MAKKAASGKVAPRPDLADVSVDGREAARAAHLHYVDDSKPGFTRRLGPDGLTYFAPNGEAVTDEAVLVRLKKLAVPPAYTDVWICRDPKGHLQAVGRDARGRKQYRYHPDWRSIRDEAKYGKMLVFGEKLPALRAQVQKDLTRPGLPRAKVLATVVALLEKTMMRIGNDEYAKTNKSFGLTTLRRRHAKVSGTGLVLDFRAKHGIQQHIELKDRRLAGIVSRLQELRGQELFQYLDEDGIQHDISSHDVNEYLQEVTGEDITAKDFRTWAATNLAALALHEFEQFDSEAKAKKNVLRAIETVAKLLGNTPAICRKCYIHPRIFDGYMDGSLAEALRARVEAALAPESRAQTGLTAEEVAVMAFLSRTLDHIADQGTVPTRALEAAGAL
ncbi:DNA topoisomerase IB [Lichenicola cladoniae]|uniref:DNA topoisomerase n=1 Tax=Lichenicola cladoniae TaxID=1484109 RepID=A0A6M8HQE0_9PROT|nr:DNA topoisomerase IB [Lichenicola cladoniae]NPD67908.1 DNA topoisomerase IB [Acetobacteraceae bacterium]QKE90507.1 DNA topoisomerase IB [Lichenicola cladoniae]